MLYIEYSKESKDVQDPEYTSNTEQIEYGYRNRYRHCSGYNHAQES